MFQTFITLLVVSTTYKTLSDKITTHPKILADKPVNTDTLFSAFFDSHICEEIMFRFILVNLLMLFITSTFYINVTQSLIFGIYYIALIFIMSFDPETKIEWEKEGVEFKIRFVVGYMLDITHNTIHAWLLFNLSQEHGFVATMLVYDSFNAAYFIYEKLLVD